MVGVRMHKRDWWAHCADIEYDGPTALQAAESVLDTIRSIEENKLYHAEKEAERLRKKLGK